MTKIDDGGPAFPQNDAAVNRINNEAGMSLRDYFAAKALPHCIRASEHDGHYDEVSAAVAAYIYADTMLAERVKGQQS